MRGWVTRDSVSWCGCGWASDATHSRGAVAGQGRPGSRCRGLSALRPAVEASPSTPKQRETHTNPGRALLWRSSSLRGLRIMVPCDAADAVGLRAVVDSGGLRRIVEVLEERARG